MALASLRYLRNAHDYEETRQGMTVFAGDAASFHEWKFRLQIKKSSCKADELPVLTAKVVDALRGEALSCAMEIGLDKLIRRKAWMSSWVTDDELHLAASSLVDPRARDGQHSRAR